MIHTLVCGLLLLWTITMAAGANWMFHQLVQRSQDDVAQAALGMQRALIISAVITAITLFL